ncbi:cellulase family glycosylhydrolase [Bacteroides sp.]|uniref:cellulase family glycosylhydrolase n=1 Tax=Bacteroides sp. TaxID=29523 RepID=UPI0026283EA5|nr:cellulase family glycosylhydrolase [Bacteroides sp.]
MTSCSDNDDSSVTPEVTIPENIVNNGMAFAKTGGTNNLSIKSNVPLEVISSAPDWCKITPEASASSTIFKYTITVDANATTEDRTSTITVNAGGSKIDHFIVTQTAADGLEIVDPTTKLFEVSAAGGNISVKLSTNGEVQVTSDATWITATDTRAMMQKIYNFSVSANFVEAREGHISFTLGNLTESVTVKQAKGESGVMTSDAKTLAAKMYAGINIGNTLEAPTGETDWGNPKVSKTYIDGLKVMGFNAVRIPCAWSSHIVNETTYEIDAKWLDRVSEVVGYCVANDMYAIVNIHWDGGWLEDHIFSNDSETINTKQKALWTQIAGKLNGYDEHLLFAGCNEPGMNETTTGGKNFDAASVATIVRYEQTFIDAVRATGGNNASRCLIVQAPSTNIDAADTWYKTLPTDKVPNRMMVEVHFYDPYQFSMMEEDANWGKMFWYWGADNHVSGSEHNATSGEESYVKEQFQKMKTNYVDKGIPAIIGEYSVIKRIVSENQEAHDNSRAYWNEVVTREAKNHGLVPFHWETGSEVNRNTGAVTDKYVIDGIMKGAKEGQYPY